METHIPTILQTIRAGRGDWNAPAPITQGEADDLANAIDALAATMRAAWVVLDTEAHPQADVLLDALILRTKESR